MRAIIRMHALGSNNVDCGNKLLSSCLRGMRAAMRPD